MAEGTFGGLMTDTGDSLETVGSSEVVLVSYELRLDLIYARSVNSVNSKAVLGAASRLRRQDAVLGRRNIVYNLTHRDRTLEFV